LNSIDRYRLRQFFEKELTPVAERLRTRGISFFATGPEPGEASWYVPGPGDDRDFLELEEHWAYELKDLWQRQELPELVALVENLIALAARLRVPENEPSDISPLVYVMY